MNYLKDLLGIAGIIAFSAGVLITAPSSATENTGSPEDFSDPDFERAIVTYDLEYAVVEYDMGRAIQRLGESENAEENVIVLETDILFEPNSWELPSGASPAIEKLVQDVSEGQTVTVNGHTDSVPVGDEHDFNNDELSERRAQAVADVLKDIRDDLTVSAEGFGDSDPAVTEDPEDPSTFAANRRVEIRSE